jgi:hypothetical protein
VGHSSKSQVIAEWSRNISETCKWGNSYNTYHQVALAGGDLSGTFPNPTIVNNVIGTNQLKDASITSSKIASGVIPTSLPPSGTAGGDLSGTYPNPTIANNVIGTSQLKDSSITVSKIASGVIPDITSTEWYCGW